MKIRFEKTMQIIPEQDVSIIDIGCGPGHYCYSLGQVGNRKILGIDFSERMIEIAQDHVKDSGGIKDLKFEVVNFLEYEPGKKFDFSILMGFIEYFKNPELVILKALGITTKKILISFPVAGFSITPDTEWAFEILAEQGIKYDSSIFPGKRFYGFHEKFEKAPTIVDTKYSEIVEFPQTLIDFGFFKLSCFGGGYFRLFPKSIFLKMANVLEKTGRPLVFYIHPRDLDTNQAQIHFPFLKK
jgi:SAM-dependent methyltransferase